MALVIAVVEQSFHQDEGVYKSGEVLSHHVEEVSLRIVEVHSQLAGTTEVAILHEEVPNESFLFVCNRILLSFKSVSSRQFFFFQGSREVVMVEEAVGFVVDVEYLGHLVPASVITKMRVIVTCKRRSD